MPPEKGAFFLGMRVELPENVEDRVLGGGQNETLEGVTSLDIEVTSIQIVHRSDKDDPATEQVLTISNEHRTFNFFHELMVQESRDFIFMEVPVGYIYQVRVIGTQMTLTFEDGEVFDVKVPSGEQTGLKIEPLDGEPFEILAGKRTAARAIFNPFKQMLRNKGQGFMMKPVVPAEPVDLSELVPLLMDRIVVRYHPIVVGGVLQPCPYSVVKSNALFGGASIRTSDFHSGYYVFNLPTSMDLVGAYTYFQNNIPGIPDIFGMNLCLVDFIAPDFMVQNRGGMKMPCETAFQSQRVAHLISGTHHAWGETTGSRQVVVAVVDTRFDMEHPDLIHQWYINVGELPKGDPNDESKPNFDVTGPTNGPDGVVDALDVDFLDALTEDLDTPEVERDHVLTFVDLNHEAVQIAVCKTANCLDRDGNGIITPKDLVSGSRFEDLQELPDASCDKADNTEPFGLENGLDDDGNGFCDDLVGWDFGGNDNYPHFVSLSHPSSTHATRVAGIIGAESFNFTEEIACPSFSSNATAGTMWGGVRILPIAKLVIEDDIADEESPEDAEDTTRSNTYIATAYASKVGNNIHYNSQTGKVLRDKVDVINASWGMLLYKHASPIDEGTKCFIHNIEASLGGPKNDPWKVLITSLDNEANCFGSLGTLEDSLTCNSQGANAPVFVIAGSQCGSAPLDLDGLDDADVYDWPTETNIKNKITVSTTNPQFDNQPNFFNQDPVHNKSLIAGPSGKQDIMILSPATFSTTQSRHSSTGLQEVYQTLQPETSFAAAYVSGVVGLMRAANLDTTNFTNEQLVAKLLENSTKYPQLSDFIKDGNVINACKAVRSVTESMETCPIPPLNGRDTPIYTNGYIFVDANDAVGQPISPSSIALRLKADDSQVPRFEFLPQQFDFRSSTNFVFSNEDLRTDPPARQISLEFSINGMIRFETQVIGFSDSPVEIKSQSLINSTDPSSLFFDLNIPQFINPKALRAGFTLFKF